MISREETHARVSALFKGPWKAKGELAFNYLHPNYRYQSIASHGQLDLRGNLRSAGDHHQIDKLANALRPHSPDDEIERHFYEIRESLDEALGHLQLIELAISTGYIQVGDVSELVRQRMFALLWSLPAKRYSQIYAFVLLRSLAARVNVRLFDSIVEPIRPLVGGDIRFAAFLSELATWFDYPALDDFLNMLDDYEPNGISSSSLAATISRNGQFLPAEMHLLIGADAFITKSASIFNNLNDDEIFLYGGYLSYWLAKFFGYQLRGRRYIRHQDSINWATQLLEANFLSDIGRREYRACISILENTWEKTRDYINAVLETEHID